MRTEKQREYDRAYYARNREEVIARKVAQAKKNKAQTYERNAKWSAKNREKVKAKDRAYYAANRERIRARMAASSRLHTLLKDAAYFRRLERKAALYQQKRDYVDQFKRQHPCPCGEDDIDCLSFHHKDGNKKEYNVSNMLGRCSLAKIQAELDKCDVICENCHRKHHARLRREASKRR